MINNIFKRIHSKYSNFFFFLKYVISIFFVSLCLFILIPKFINYEKKQVIISQFLDNFYYLELKNFESIKYNIFPIPNLSIKNANIKLKNETNSLYIKNLRIYLNLNKIHNIENLKPSKVFLKDIKFVLDIDNVRDIVVFLEKLKNRISIKGLDLILKRNNNSILEVNNVQFSNYGYEKGKISGIIFDKKFKLKNDDKNKNLSFKILKTGIKAKLNFEKIKDKFISGSSKVIILNNYLKSNFVIQNDKLELLKANFRNDNISLSLNSVINFNPFFDMKSNIEINKLDRKIFDRIEVKKILNNHEILKRFNSQTKINYNKKKKIKHIIHNYLFNIELEHGRLFFLSNIDILGGKIKCSGNSFLLEQYPRLNFKCIVETSESERILKKFLIKKKMNKDLQNLNIIGSINILNNKINFKNIFIGKTYKAKKEELNYFKKVVEEILLDETLLDAFKKNKIKKFLIEII